MSAPEKEALPPPESEGNQRLKLIEEKKHSWVNVVKNKQSLTNHTIEVMAMANGSGVVEIPEDVVEESVPLWEDFLEGRFMSEAPHVAKIHVIVNKIWPLGEKSIRIDVYPVNKTVVKFRIKDKATRLRVLCRGMWNLADIPLILSKWSPVEEQEEVEIKKIPMWITLKNVPNNMYSWSGIGFIASAVGKPIRLHPEIELCSTFEETKVFVEADMSKELPKMYRFRSKSGIDAEIEFTYPWLPPRCSKWGHILSSCVINGKKITLATRNGEEAIQEQVKSPKNQSSGNRVTNQRTVCKQGKGDKLCCH